MSKFSYKSLFIIFFFLLIGVVVLSRFVLPNKKVSASWWNESWSYRQAISVVNNTNFDATNTPYKVEIDTQTLISNNKLQADADDIRVVNSEGKIVRYQIEKSTLNTSKTKLWFETTVKSNSTSFYYIYYGNSIASPQNFESDINTVTSNSSTVTIEMKDGFGYTTSKSNGGRISDIRKNSTDLGVDGNIIYSSSYPGNWWSSSASTQTILNSTGPLFVEVNYGAGATGSYSAHSTNHKIFNNGFAETQISVTYNTSGSENFYYYLSFLSGTRNSVWVNGSGTLVDQDADSGGLNESSLGQNWFGQRWTATDIYGGTIITKNGSDWNSGQTSTRASYYQTNYSYTTAFVNGTSREVRFGVFAGNGGLSEMQQKGANYGALGSSLNSEEISPAPIAYWKFDEGVGTTTYDSSSSQKNGSLGTGNSTPTWQSEDQCISGKCLNFLGGAYMSSRVQTSGSLLLSDIFTISHWIKSSGGGYSISNAGSGNGYRLGIGGGGRVGFLIGNNGGYTETSCGTKVINDNKWHLITGIYNNSTNKFTCYIDGKYEAEVTVVDFTGFQTSAPAIGGYTYTGYIDDVKFYNYARTAEQIKLEYNSRGSSKGSSVNLGVKSNTNPSLSSKLITYWKFDEGIGTTINNSISSNYKLNSSGQIQPTVENNGKINKALYFYGIGATNRSYLSTNPINTGNNGTLTFSFWIKPDSSQIGNGWIIRNGTSSDENYGIKIGTPSSNKYRLSVERYIGSFTTTNATNYVIPSLEWSHIAIVLTDGSSWKYFLNGKYIETISAGSTAANATGTLSIGGHGGTTSQFLNGHLDEFKIYNTGLTDEEIRQDYNSGATVQFGSTNQTIGGTTTSLEYCIPGDTTYCAPPVAEWNFEENTGTIAKDISGNNNTGNFGTGNSAPTWTVGAKNKGAGLNFSSVDKLSLGSTVSLGNTNWTVSGWMKTSNSGNNTLISNSSGGPVTNALRIFNSKINYSHYDGTWKHEYGTSNIDDNQWHFLTWVNHDNQTIDLYVDGKKEGSTLPSTVNNNGPVDQIGRDWSTSANASIDQIRIYNYARTPAQIAYDYNKGGPVGWWKLDECQGLTAFDSSGSGYTGAISIGPSGSQTSAGTCQVGTSAAWTAGASGKINSSLNFDGTDDYYITNQPQIQTSPNLFTITGFINPENQSGYILTPASCGYDQRLAYDTSNQRLIIQIAEASDTNERSRTSTNGSVPLDKWTHFAVSINDKDIKIYINGSLDAQYNEAIGICAWTGNWYFGQRGLSTSWYKGKIDDMRIYNYALTSEQVKTVYNNGSVNFR